MALTAIIPLFLQKLSEAKIAKARQVADALKINVNWLLAVFYFESGRTFSTSVTNNIGSVGLIQFTRDKAGVNYKTIAGKRYVLSDIAKMDWDDQLDLVLAYYKEAIGKKTISSFEDLYLATFFPAAVGQADSFVLQTKTLSASLIATQNPAFDTNKDGKITKAEVYNYFKKLYEGWGVDYGKYIGSKTSIVSVILTLVAVFFYTAAAVTL